MTGRISDQTKQRDLIVEVGRSIFDRGLTFGSTGNISVRLDDGTILMSPTNASLGAFDPARLSLVSEDGHHLSGDPPTKEAFLHTCMYCQRQTDGAVVHLHSTHSVALSLLNDLDPEDVIPPLTAYYVMRVGKLPLIPYYPPGDKSLAFAVKEYASDHHAMLLANHGPIVSGKDLRTAQYAIEELEETARIFLMMHDRNIRPLTQDQAAALRPGVQGESK